MYFVNNLVFYTIKLLQEWDKFQHFYRHCTNFAVCPTTYINNVYNVSREYQGCRPDGIPFQYMVIW